MAKFTIQKAEKIKRKMRLALIGVSKSGKTLTMLKFLRALVGEEGKFAVLSSEGDNCQQYTGANGVGDFDLIVLDDFSPTNYIEAMQYLVKQGYGAIGIDSLSHAWSGKGGCLEIADSGGGGSSKFTTGWGKATPLHNKLIAEINACPVHLIATMRQKADYILETNSQGKTVPKRVGMAAVQREGMEYEFDITGEMHEATLTVDGIRGEELEGYLGKSFTKPNADFIDAIRACFDDKPYTPVSKPEKPEHKPQATPPADTSPEAQNAMFAKAKAAIQSAKAASDIAGIRRNVKLRGDQGLLSDSHVMELLDLCTEVENSFAE